MLAAVAEDPRYKPDLPHQLLLDADLADAQRKRAGNHHRRAGRTCGPKTLMEMYQIATADTHGFMHVSLLNQRNQMFYKGFDQRFVLAE